MLIHNAKKTNKTVIDSLIMVTTTSDVKLTNVLSTDVHPSACSVSVHKL